MNDAVVIIGHGTRSVQGLHECRVFAQAIAERLARPMRLCFLELIAPDMIAGLREAACEVGPQGAICVLPLFLGKGDHYKIDVPQALRACRQAYPHIRLRYAKPLGPHPQLAALLRCRVHDAYQKARAISKIPASETAVLIVGRGSSDEESNRAIANLAASLEADRTWLTVRYAFQAVKQPTITEGLQDCEQFGATHVVVAPYLLFAGRLQDAIRNTLTQATLQVRIPALQIFYTSYLGCEPIDSRLIDVAEQRIRHAAIWSS